VRRQARTLIGAVLVTACGRVAFDERPPDALDAFDLCAAEREVLGAWSTPRPLTTVNHPTQTEDDPVVSADGLELYFTSPRPPNLGQSDVWRSVRTSATEPWEAPQPVPELSTASNENTLELSNDALTMWFASDRPGTLGNEDMWVVTRPDRISPWGTAINVTALNTPGLERGPSVFLDETALIFHTGRAGGPGGNDFWLATRPDRAAPWSVPKPMPSPPNTPADELRGWVSPCGHEMYYQSTRGGTMDFYLVRREALDQPFGLEQRIGELSDAAVYDQDLRLSPDRRYAIFSTDRSGGGDLYESSR
jgi:hypothetical protein